MSREKQILKNEVQVASRVSDKTHNAIKKIAVAEDRSVAWVVRKILEDNVAEYWE